MVTSVVIARQMRIRFYQTTAQVERRLAERSLFEEFKANAEGIDHHW